MIETVYVLRDCRGRVVRTSSQPIVFDKKQWCSVCGDTVYSGWKVLFVRANVDEVDSADRVNLLGLVSFQTMQEIDEVGADKVYIVPPNWSPEGGNLWDAALGEEV